MSPSPVGEMRMTMSESDEVREVTPRRADQVVKQEKNSSFNPAVSTEEVADALGIEPDAAYELLEEAPRPTKKPVGDTHIWW